MSPDMLLPLAAAVVLLAACAGVVHLLVARPALSRAERAEARAAAAERDRAVAEAKVDELGRIGAEIELKFATLASEVLGKNSENFLALVSERFEKHKTDAEADLDKRRTQIENLVKPLRDGLDKFDLKMGEIDKAQVHAATAVTEQVKLLARGLTGLQTETGRLVQALRRPQTRGRWGEYQLRNVLEMAGMTEHVDFTEQGKIGGPDGPLYPDVVIRLPGGKSLVVDAKTPLDAYLKAIEAENEDERQQHLDSHARQVQAQVQNLSRKAYWERLTPTPDFVVMFVPGEAMLATAMERDPGLFERAVQGQVLISTPMTLIALVKAIAYGWQQDRLAENMLEVVQLARELHGRIKIFGEHMDKMGAALKRAVGHYNDSVGSLEGRVLVTARKLADKGVASDAESIPGTKRIEEAVRGLAAPELLGRNAGGPP